MIASVITLIATPAAQASQQRADVGAGTTARQAFPRLGLSQSAVKRTARPQCRSARRGLIYYRFRHSSWLELRGVSTQVNLRQPHGCAYTLWLAKLERGRARTARFAYYRWRESRWTLREQRDWLGAVNEAQKAYPGTKPWLWSCSSTEGGHGPFVQNRDGANVWGWVQMHPDTFHRFWVRGWYDPGSGRSYIGAYDSLVRRGFKVQAVRSGSAIDDPLAHALAAAHSLVNGRRGEYHSSGC